MLSAYLCKRIVVHRVNSANCKMPKEHYIIMCLEYVFLISYEINEYQPNGRMGYQMCTYSVIIYCVL